ncbi:MAG: STAS domain-containing protein [Acidobacteriota bacterium]
MQLRLESAFAGNVHIIRCSGAIILGEESGALEAAFKERSLGYTHFVLTLTGVHRLDSIGLGLIVRYMTSVRQRGGDLRIAAPSGFVSTLLNKTMLSTVLRIFSTEAEAVDSYHHAKSDSRPAALHGGRRVLAVDPSLDLCAFVRTVLSRHHFAIRTCSMLQDAKTVLRSNPVEIVLIGPGSAHLSPDTMAQSLGSIAPEATILRIPPEFKTQNAQEATGILLEILGVSAT